MLGLLLAAAAKLAVLELSNAVPAVDRAVVSQAIRGEAVRAGRAVMTREEMVQLANANPLLETCNEQSCVEVGRLLGADVVVDGSIAKSPRGKIHVALRMVDVKSGKRVKVAAGDAAKAKDAAVKAAKALFKD